MHLPSSALRVAFLLIAFSIAATAAHAQNPRSPAARELAALLDESDATTLRLNPQLALSRGDRRYAAEFGDLISDSYRRATERQAREELAALARIPRAELHGVDRIAYDVFRNDTEIAAQTHTDGVAEIFQQMPIDQLAGQHLTFAQFSSGTGIAPFETVADYRAGLARLDGFVIYLDRAITMMRRGIAAGHVHPKAISEKIVAQLDAALAVQLDDSPYMGPVKSFPAGIPKGARKRLEAAYRGKVRDQVMPAYQRMRAFIAEEYLPASRTGAPGLAGMRDGAKLYAYALQLHTTTRMTADEIHALGLAEVSRIESEMRQVQQQVGFRGSLADFLRHIQTDPQFQFKDAEALLDSYRAVWRALEPKLGAVFARMPQMRFEIRAVPSEQESSAGGAYYIPGTIDGSRPGVFYVNTGNLPSRTSPRATALFLHEAVPGHHLQAARALENTALPPTLRYTWNPGYGEGWALYCEWLGRELGMYSDPYQYFGRLEMEMFRAVRLVLDTGLHAKAWAREQAIDYMLAHTSFDREFAASEVDRYLVWPGQATSYKVGEIFLRRLRAKAEAALGKEFDLRDFHEQVLDTGALPLAVLELKIDDWIAARSAPQ